MLQICNLAILLFIVIFGFDIKSAEAQESASVLYVPLIGITSVPQPLALPKGAGKVTYSYAVKNFLTNTALTDVQVVDNKCNSVQFVTGDDNGNSQLDYSETWRYTCATKLSETTHSTATATGTANTITATHKAYATVIIGSNTPPPLVSIINITKVAYPLSLPTTGGNITFTYKVNNPGVVPLSNVAVTDDKCQAMSSKLGDTNSNNLLDTQEVWIYTCTTNLKQTTTNTAQVTASANGLEAVSDTSLTVKVDTSNKDSLSTLFDVGISHLMVESSNLKIIAWIVLSGILTTLVVVFVLTRKKYFN